MILNRPKAKKRNGSAYFSLQGWDAHHAHTKFSIRRPSIPGPKSKLVGVGCWAWALKLYHVMYTYRDMRRKRITCT